MSIKDFFGFPERDKYATKKVKVVEFIIIITFVFLMDLSLQLPAVKIAMGEWFAYILTGINIMVVAFLEIAITKYIIVKNKLANNFIRLLWKETIRISIMFSVIALIILGLIMYIR